MKKYIIDAGHGWETKGKESIFHKLLNGKAILKENNVTEAICNKISVLHDNVEFISNEWNDISLNERIKREYALYEEGNSLFMSVHADAFVRKDIARGGTFFYYSESGKKIAYHYYNYLRDNNYRLRLRAPKQANFKILRESKSKAILFELGFMTTGNDLNIMMKEEYRNHTSHLLVDAFNELPIHYL